MASLNRVSLIGNLGKDPEVRYLPSGDAVANFSLATTETWKDKSGQKQEKTEWHSVEVFGALAKIVQDYCTKGKQIYIEGSITYQEWTDKDNVKKNRTKIKLSGPQAKLVLLGGGKRERDEEETEEDYEPREPQTMRQKAGVDDFQVSDDDVPF
jgi:single-strand DNA-binding protein